MAQPAVKVYGADSLAKLFEALPPILEKKYMRQLVQKTVAHGRGIARRMAPVGPTANKPSNHRPLKRNIKAGKLSSKKGIVRGKITANKGGQNQGARHSNPLYAGHGNARKKTPNIFDAALNGSRTFINQEGAKLVRQFIDKDAAKLGKKQAEGTLSKAGAKRLGLLQGAGFA